MGGGGGEELVSPHGILDQMVQPPGLMSQWPGPSPGAYSLLEGNIQGWLWDMVGISTV